MSIALKGEINFLPAILSDHLWQPGIFALAGTLMGFMSILIFIGALISFRESWRIGIDTENPGKLVTGGIFAVSRNPIFLSMYIFFIGVFAAYPNLFFLLFAAGAVTGIHIQILQEEKFLTEYYGKEYEKYKNEVRRYF